MVFHLKKGYGKDGEEKENRNENEKENGVVRLE